MELIVNNRRDPKILKTYFDELKSAYPWKNDNEVLDMAKSLYARKHRSK